jgi:chitosanase
VDPTRRSWRRGAVIASLLVLLLLAATLIALTNRLSGQAPADSGADSARSVDPRDPRLSLTLDAQRKHRAAQLTSSFENATLELQYDYADNIGDGRGITAGRAGFTSATGDLLLLVRRYTETEPDNVLAPYIPALEEVEGTDSERGLDGFTDAWAEAAEDPEQRKLQDDLVDELYFTPAMAIAADVGVETPLGQAIVWDTMIQHGAGGENGTRAIIAETREAAGDAGQDESGWLDVFLDVRLRHLRDAYEDADESSESRVNALRSLVEAGDLALEPPLTWEVYGQTFSLPAT